jgi:hypothetical protein
MTPVPLRFFSFSLLIGLGTVLGHLYLYRRLVRDTVRSRGTRLLAMAALVLLSLPLMLRRTLQRSLPGELADAIAVAAYTILFIGLAWEYSAGLYRHGDSHIYVSRGCGFWGPPMRVGSPPEIVKLVLTS